MVFGNLGDDCATGVAFTRDPSTGERKFYGEFLVNAQGEDVVAGIRTPQPIIEGTTQKSDAPALEEAMPEVVPAARSVRETLEKHFRDMQDIEFTIAARQALLLQTRTGKRTARRRCGSRSTWSTRALIDEQEAVAARRARAARPAAAPDDRSEGQRATSIAKGLPASPGRGDRAGRLHRRRRPRSGRSAGEKVILVRRETSPEDIHGMKAAARHPDRRGGMTSHAAVVARGMGKCCVVGCRRLPHRRRKAGDVRRARHARVQGRRRHHARRRAPAR